MKNGRKWLAGVLALAMVVTTLVPGLGSFSASAGQAPVGEFTETSIKLDSTGKLSSTDSGRTGSDGSYNGLICSVQDSKALAGKYFRIDYTVTGEVTDDAKLFNVQPFDKSWGGWNDNIITAGEGIKNGDAYTTYVELDKIKASLSTGKALKGINISFFSSDVNAKVTSVKYMVENSQAPADDEDDHQLASDKVILDIKGDDLVAAGIDAQALIDGNKKATFYVNIT